MASFFTWIEEVYTEQSEVPLRLRHRIRYLFLKGVDVDILARVFQMPLEWVEDFVRGDTSGDTNGDTSETTKH